MTAPGGAVLVSSWTCTRRGADPPTLEELRRAGHLLSPAAG